MCQFGSHRVPPTTKTSRSNACSWFAHLQVKIACNSLNNQINMVNEKIFLFLWFWLMGLALVGMLNLLLWLFRAFNWDSSYQFVQSQLVSYNL